jgi:hypothetical protein
MNAESASVFSGSGCASASCYCIPENIVIKAIVVPELKLSNVERQIFPAHLVVAAHHAALQDRPEAFDGIGVNCADNIITAALADNLMREGIAKKPISGMFVGCQQANLCGDSFAHKAVQRECVGIVDHAQNDIALAANRTDYGVLARTDPASAAPALVLMFVVPLAANIGFVNLNDPAEFVVLLLSQCSADAMGHVPCGLERTETHVAPKLPRTHAFLAGEQEMGHAEPFTERLIRVLENRSGDDGEAIAGRATRGALGTLPMPRAGFQLIDLGVAATRAMDFFGPPTGLEIGFAMFLIGEHCLELLDINPVNGLGFLAARHGQSPIERNIG